MSEVLNIGIASMRIKCWRGFVVKTSIDMTSGMTSALIWSVVMASWQKWIVDVTSWLRYEWSVERQMKCCRGFMTKINVVITSIWMKCRCGLNANRMLRQLYGKRRVLVQLHYKGKWWCAFIADASVNIASWQRWMLAWLHGKGSRYGYVAKNSWNDCVEKISVGAA